MAYFSLSALWGFLVGAAGPLTVLLLMEGETQRLGGLLPWLLLIPLAGVAVGGGALMAGAYREARRRRRM